MTSDEDPSVTDTGFYDSTYGTVADQLAAGIRAEAFGEDIGQTSWITADEYRIFFGWLGLSPSSEVLEIASGSGGPALFMAEQTGCHVTGVDIHEGGVEAGNQAAAARGLTERARFIVVDARQRLPFDDASFDVVMCIDAINHMYERRDVLLEWTRVLRPGGQVLFTDPITVTGMIRREEMITRSGAMGEFVFTPAGLDEELLRECGFEDIQVHDRTANMASVPAAWRQERERHGAQLDQIEGPVVNANTQDFLDVVQRLATERRLTRLAFLARKP